MKYSLNDTTFIIPFFADSRERQENLNCILTFLNRNFTTSIILIEEGMRAQTPLLHMPLHRYTTTLKIYKDVFYRTHVINEAIKLSKTKFIVIYDTDCLFDTKSILLAQESMDAGCDACYPFDGRFIDIDRKYITTGIIVERESYVINSVGGAVFLNRQRYIEAGMENENLRGHAPEDQERYSRMRTLGYNIERVYGGKCWHLPHPSAAANNPFKAQNDLEYSKIKGFENNMTEGGKEQLQEYIKTWKWCLQTAHI